MRKDKLERRRIEALAAAKSDAEKAAVAVAVEEEAAESDSDESDFDDDQNYDLGDDSDEEDRFEATEEAEEEDAEDEEAWKRIQEEGSRDEVEAARKRREAKALQRSGTLKKLEGDQFTGKVVTTDEFAQLVKRSCRLPVENTDNTGDPSYKGSWVCEASLAPKEDSVMFTAKRLHKLTTTLRRCRASVKRTRTRVFEARQAGKKTAALEKKLAKVRNRLAKVADAQNRILERIAGKWTPFSQAEREAETRVAFVTFNHVVSAECCIEDYRDARSRCPSRFVRNKLFFSGSNALPLHTATARVPILA